MKRYSFQVRTSSSGWQNLPTKIHDLADNLPTLTYARKAKKRLEEEFGFMLRIVKTTTTTEVVK